MASSTSAPPSAAVDSLAASVASLSQRMAELRQYAEEKLATMGCAPARAPSPSVTSAPTTTVATAAAPPTSAESSAAPTTPSSTPTPAELSTPAASPTTPVLLFGVPIGFTSAASVSPAPSATSTPSAPYTPIGFTSAPTTTPPPSPTSDWSPPYLMATKNFAKKQDRAFLSFVTRERRRARRCSSGDAAVPFRHARLRHRLDHGRPPRRGRLPRLRIQGLCRRPRARRRTLRHGHRRPRRRRTRHRRSGRASAPSRVFADRLPGPRRSMAPPSRCTAHSPPATHSTESSTTATTAPTTVTIPPASTAYQDACSVVDWGTPAILCRNALKVFDAMPYHHLFVLWFSAETFVMLLHAVANDQDTTSSSTSRWSATVIPTASPASPTPPLPRDVPSMVMVVVSSRPGFLSIPAAKVFVGMSSLEESALSNNVSIPAMTVHDAVCSGVIASRQCKISSASRTSSVASADYPSVQFWWVKMLTEQLQRSIPFPSPSECDQIEWSIGLFVYMDSLFPWVSGKCSVAVRGHDLLPQPKPPDQSGRNIPDFKLLLASGFAFWDPGGSSLQLLWSNMLHMSCHFIFVLLEKFWYPVWCCGLACLDQESSYKFSCKRSVMTAYSIPGVEFWPENEFLEIKCLIQDVQRTQCVESCSTDEKTSERQQLASDLDQKYVQYVFGQLEFVASSDGVTRVSKCVQNVKFVDLGISKGALFLWISSKCSLTKQGKLLVHTQQGTAEDIAYWLFVPGNLKMAELLHSDCNYWQGSELNSIVTSKRLLRLNWDPGSLDESGLRVSRILSGGECHVLGRWMGLRLGCGTKAWASKLGCGMGFQGLHLTGAERINSKSASERRHRTRIDKSSSSCSCYLLGHVIPIF